MKARRLNPNSGDGTGLDSNSKAQLNHGPVN